MHTELFYPATGTQCNAVDARIACAREENTQTNKDCKFKETHFRTSEDICNKKSNERENIA